MIYQLGDLQVNFEGSDHFIAESASVIGDVSIAEGCSIWFGAVVRGDDGPIRIGARTNVQDGAVLHTDPGLTLNIGQDVTIGHQAMLHGCEVGEGSLIGIQSVVLNRALIGKECLIGAKTLVPEGMAIPDGVLVLGSPAKIRRELTKEERQLLCKSAGLYAQKAQKYRQTLSQQKI